MRSSRRLLVFVLAASLSIGAATHWVDIYRSGFLGYSFAPFVFNVFWTALAVVDLLAAYLLFRHRRSGLILSIAIMLSDVGINSYATYGLGLFPACWPLQVQTLFLGFLLGCTGLLWPNRDPR